MSFARTPTLVTGGSGFIGSYLCERPLASWSPTVALREGLDRTIAYFKSTI